MCRPLYCLLLFAVAFETASAATVGSGTSPAIQQSFINAFNRGQFSHLVLAPTTDVRALGSPGLVQEFPSAVAGSTLKGALVKPSPTAALSTNPPDTFQMYPDLYTYYSTIGVGTAGYPTIDTTSCPPSNSGLCNYQLFTKNYALFVYSSPFPASYSVADPFFTEWSNNGGIGSLGAATSATGTVTSLRGTAGTQQLFAAGAIFSYTPASSSPSLFSVSGAFFSAFSSVGGIAALGFPTSEELVLTSGLHRQTFENGRIELTPGGTANVLFAIREINISASLGQTLALGTTATVTALVYDTQNNPATGRTLTWSTSNGNAVTVQGSGYTATIKAVGPGSARIVATGEGITSLPFVVTVISQCCGIGDGAPTQSIGQAFQTAAARNQLTVLLPNPTPVTRIGPGYVQFFTAADGSGAVYAISQADNSSIAYVISGKLYTEYLAAGGLSGPLGFPTSDASAGGTQFFTTGAALAGSPPRLIPSPIAARWAAAGAESGALGAPAAAAGTFVSISGFAGNVQNFAGGTIFGITSGSRAGRTFVSSGLILERYLALSGPAGPLGVPVSDVLTTGDVLVQNFETGYIDLQPGAAAAVEHFNPRNPTVTVAPGAVAPGGKVHVTLAGFAFGASLSVSATGSPAFSVTVPAGQFAWDIVVPANVKPGSVSIQAKAAGSSDTASGAYTVVSVAQLRPSLSIVSGDQQTGAPGAVLASPLVALLTDINRNPLPGVPVAYEVAPGASVTGDLVTDASGRIHASLRMPLAAGVSGLTIAAGGQVVSFSALSAAKIIAGFPAFTQASPQGGFVAALAALVRYYQNGGSLGTPNGPATAAGVSQYLATSGGFSSSETGTPIPNPWAAMKFAGVAGGVVIEPPTLERIRDLVNAGSPLVLEMSVQVDGVPAGSAAVNAIGINVDGSIVIVDPNPTFGRVSLSDYLNGFAAQGHSVLGVLSGVIRVAPALSTPAGFVLASPLSASTAADSPAGVCVNAIDITDAAIAGQGPPASIGGVRFLECDGAQSTYQLSFGINSGASVLDLASGAVQQISSGSARAFQATRTSGALALQPQTMAVTSVTNAAGFGSGLAPGGIFSVFGAGFTAGAAGAAVTINGQQVTLIAALPFQINAIMPAAIAPGAGSMQVTGPLGSVTRDITILPNAPGIFVTGVSEAGLSVGAIVNQDGTINSPSNPAQRGQYISIYCTGLGATAAQGALQAAVAPVSASVGGIDLKPQFAGGTPGYPGLYQVNVQVPAAIPPGPETQVTIQQNGVTSNAVVFAVE